MSKSHLSLTGCGKTSQDETGRDNCNGEQVSTGKDSNRAQQNRTKRGRPTAGEEDTTGRDPQVQVKGKRKPIKAYEVLCAKDLSNEDC